MIPLSIPLNKSGKILKIMSGMAASVSALTDSMLVYRHTMSSLKWLNTRMTIKITIVEM